MGVDEGSEYGGESDRLIGSTGLARKPFQPRLYQVASAVTSHTAVS